MLNITHYKWTIISKTNFCNDFHLKLETKYILNIVPATASLTGIFILHHNIEVF